MPQESAEHVARELPHRFHQDERCVGIDALEHLPALGLAEDEAVGLRVAPALR